jgi:hypothetical protein
VALLFWLRVSYSTYSIGEERQTGLPYFHLLKTLPNLVMTLHASLSIVLSCNRKLFFNIFCAKKKNILNSDSTVACSFFPLCSC